MRVRWLAVLASFVLPIGSFGQLNQFTVTLIKAPVDSRLFLGGGGSLHLNSVSGGVAVGTQTGASGFTQGLVFDVPTQNLIRIIDPVSELSSVATGANGPVIAGDTIQVNPTIVQSFTHNTCLTDGYFGLPPVPFPIQNWTWCTGIDANGNVVGYQITTLVVTGTSDPPSSGFTQSTLNAFVDGTLLGPGRAWGVSGDEQVGDINGGTTAVLWHGSAQSMVQLGTICDAVIFRNHNGCDNSEALTTNGSQEGGFSTFGPSPGHATMWYGTAGSQTDVHPALFTSSRITGLSTVFQAGDGWMNGDAGAVGALHHGLLWQGTAASAIDLNPILPPDYPYVTITGASPAGEVSGYIEKDLNGAPDPTTGVGIVLTPIPSMSVGSLTLSPSNAAPGDTVTATVTLRAPAAAGGVWVNITSSDSVIVPTPASVLIPEGQTSVSVNVATAAAFLTSPEAVTLTAIAGYTGSAAILTMTPKTPADPIVSISVTTGRVNPGVAASGSITLAAAAPAGGMIVSFNALLMTVTLSPVVDPACGCLDQNITTYSAPPPGLISIPASVIVPEGQTTASFSIATANPVNASTNVIRQVVIQAATGNVMKQAILTVGPPPVLQSLDFDDYFGVPTANPYPGQTSGNLFGVRLNVPTDAPITVTFTSTNPAIVMPPSVVINAGAGGASFFFSTLGAPAVTTGIVTATANGVSVSAPVSVAPVPQPVLTSVSIPFVSSGQTFTGKVVLSSGALLGGATITLTSDTPGVAAVPASIVIPFGSTTGMFTGIAGPVAGPVTVTITATFNGIAQTGTLSVLPGPVLSITNFTLSPYTMVGPGIVTTGTISLNQPAPPGGVTVGLTSNSSAAKVPATVTVAAGQSSASVSAQGNGVSVTTPVILTATYSGGLAPLGPVSASASLTVAPTDVLKAAVKPTWSTSTHLLTATVTSTNPQAIVTALNANGNVPLGVMTNLGNGNYTFQMTVDSISSVNFKSNLGGATGQGVTVIS